MDGWMDGWMDSVSKLAKPTLNSDYFLQSLFSLSLVFLSVFLILCPCVLVICHQLLEFYSNTQEREYRGRMNLPGYVLDIKDASNADLR